MTGGFVYVLSNRAMPDLVKVGRTERMPTQRAMELQTSGVPLPFDIEFAMWFQDSVEAEREIHEELHDHRVSGNREFFCIEPIEAAKRLAVIGLSQLAGSFLEVVDVELVIHTPDIYFYAERHGIDNVRDVPSIVSQFNDKEWGLAKQRHEERVAARKAIKMITVNDGNFSCDAPEAAG